jgi:hypothetical protein
MGRFARSWVLIKSSWAVLKQDKELMILPLVSGLALMAIAASFVFGMGLIDTDTELVTPKNLLPMFAFYVISYTVGFYFQAALVAGALQRLAGGNPTLGSSLGAANRRLGAIAMWGVFAGTVGMLLRVVQERSEIVGKILVGLVGVAWSLATFFMVPILVMENEPVGASFKRSWALFKKTWGETVIGNGGISLISFLAFLAVGLVVYLLAMMGLGLLAVIVAVVGFLGLPLVTSTLSGIYLAALYRFATTGDVAEGFDRDVLASAYRPK